VSSAAHRGATSDPYILIVDDDEDLRRLLHLQLASHGWRTREMPDAQAILGAFASSSPIAVILDLGLPDMDGLELLRRLRDIRQDVPILVLSNCLDEAVKVAALEGGAADYMVKPIGAAELAARIKARARLSTLTDVVPLLQAGGLSLQHDGRTVIVRGRIVLLTQKEFAVLECLMERPGEALSLEYILKRVWQAQVDAQLLRVYIRTLRGKIESDPDHPKLIVSERGVGYSFRGT
jgi:two-component system KDP operon response regulator KdpE